MLICRPFFVGDMYEDALEYPFLSAMIAPFGPEAGQPFEQHLRQLHSECGQEHGGCWFRMSGPAKASRAPDGMTGTGGPAGAAAGEGQTCLCKQQASWLSCEQERLNGSGAEKIQ